MSRSFLLSHRLRKRGTQADAASLHTRLRLLRPRGSPVQLHSACQRLRWELSWEPSSVDWWGRLWTPVEPKAFGSGMCGRLCTHVDTAWRSTDQKDGDSSSPGRAVVLIVSRSGGRAVVGAILRLPSVRSLRRLGRRSIWAVTAERVPRSGVPDIPRLMVSGIALRGKSYLLPVKGRGESGVC